MDDYQGNIVVMCAYLEELGYSVTIARNGREAIDALSKENFGIVFMDVQMPIMDGHEATRSIRESQRKGKMPQVPIIGLTASAMADDREKCLASGMDDYLSKPVNSERLREWIDRYVVDGN